MSTNDPAATTMTDVLRRAIVESMRSGETYLGLSKATGLTRASISRFVEGRNSLRLDLADRLAAHLGIRCVPPRRRAPSKAKAKPTTARRRRRAAASEGES